MKNKTTGQMKKTSGQMKNKTADNAGVSVKTY